MADSEELDDLSRQVEQSVKDGERLCAELKAQLRNAKALVTEAKQKLSEATNEPRSFASGDRPLQH